MSQTHSIWKYRRCQALIRAAKSWKTIAKSQQINSCQKLYATFLTNQSKTLTNFTSTKAMIKSAKTTKIFMSADSVNVKIKSERKCSNWSNKFGWINAEHVITTFCVSDLITFVQTTITVFRLKVSDWKQSFFFYVLCSGAIVWITDKCRGEKYQWALLQIQNIFHSTWQWNLCKQL